MTRTEYIKALAALYRVANSSDQDDAPDWLPEDACSTHCRVIEEIFMTFCARELWEQAIDGNDTYLKEVERQESTQRALNEAARA
tara:strand:+ start:381 stop:635 length:255 start_codon:yes stop_codon:yes gene_type:complete